MSRVFVLDTKRKPLDPCHPARARMLLRDGKAAVFKRYPFTIILKYEIDNEITQPYQLKIDPGSKTTGIAVVNQNNGEVAFAAELTHRGQIIKDRLEKRKNVRRNRRNRKTRYREARYLNRTKAKGWLPPSLMSRVHNIITWVKKLSKVIPIKGITQELVKFDTQKMMNAEITGVQNRQGELDGYEVREYLLEKFNRTCMYCDAQNVRLEVEHVIAKSKGGSDRISNLGIACHDCNQKKGNRKVEEFVKDKEKLKKIKERLKVSLKDTAAVNSTKNRLLNELKNLGYEVETGSGSLTKFNRVTRGIEKGHWQDAACVGMSTPINLKLKNVKVLGIKAMGHGCRQMCRVDAKGFPRTGSKERAKKHFGFQTGDIVQAVIPIQSRSVNRGRTFKGRIVVKKLGDFTITIKYSKIYVYYKNCKIIHHTDGYTYF